MGLHVGKSCLDSSYGGEDNKAVVKQDSSDRLIAEIDERFRRHVGVLTEDFEKQVKTIAEQCGWVVQKLNEHDEKFVRIEAKLERHDLEFVRVQARFDNLENRFGNLENRFDKLDKQIGVVLTDHEHRLKGIEQKL